MMRFALARAEVASDGLAGVDFRSQGGKSGIGGDKLRRIGELSAPLTCFCRSDAAIREGGISDQLNAVLALGGIRGFELVALFCDGAQLHVGLCNLVGGSLDIGESVTQAGSERGIRRVLAKIVNRGLNSGVIRRVVQR